MARIAIIGGGSMGEAILAGLLRAGRQVKDLVVAERVPERVEYLSSTYSVRVTSVSNAVENAAFVIVAVKPTDTRQSSPRSPRLPRRPTTTPWSRSW